MPHSPIEQLLMVFPPQSSKLLPEKYRNLMIDYSSPLIEYYPIDFEVDYSYKVYTWEGHPHLPPLDYKLIKNTLKTLDK